MRLMFDAIKVFLKTFVPSEDYLNRIDCHQIINTQTFGGYLMPENGSFASSVLYTVTLCVCVIFRKQDSIRKHL